jgi:hypothetical protein
MRSEIFICYSRKDKKWRDAIKKHLKPHFRENQITIWDDTQIHRGKDWHQDIQDALRRAKVAILLVSSDFLESDYIHENELPGIFHASQTDGLSIIWIAVGPSAYRSTPIGKLHCAHDNPDQDLSNIPRPQREKILVEIAGYVASLFRVP